MSNSIIHFREHIDIAANGNPFGYLTMWNGHTNGFGGHHMAESLQDTIETFDDARRFWALAHRWTNFVAIMYGPVGLGGKAGETTDGNGDPIWIDYPIDDYVDTDTITLTVVFTYAFDPADNDFGEFRIVDPGTGTVKHSGLDIQFGTGRYPTWPSDNGTVTIINFKGTPNLQDVFGFDTWVFQRPQKTITQWKDWFGPETTDDTLLDIIDDTLDRQ